MAPRLPSQFSDPDQSPGNLLVQVTAAWQRRQRAALSELGLTHPQFLILAAAAWLTRDGEPVTQVRLARHARTDPMMTSQLVRALEEKKLLRRSEDPSDSRAKLVRATARGRKLARQAVVIADRVDREFFEPADGRALLQELRAIKAGHKGGP
jgi:MarR family transcriptional regulator, organic hydroperoxide resistance regulator